MLWILSVISIGISITIIFAEDVLPYCLNAAITEVNVSHQILNSSAIFANPAPTVYPLSEYLRETFVKWLLLLIWPTGPSSCSATIFKKKRNLRYVHIGTLVITLHLVRIVWSACWNIPIIFNDFRYKYHIFSFIYFILFYCFVLINIYDLIYNFEG